MPAISGGRCRSGMGMAIRIRRERPEGWRALLRGAPFRSPPASAPDQPNSRNFVARMKRGLIICRSLDRFQLPKTKPLRQIAESVPPLPTRYVQH